MSMMKKAQMNISFGMIFSIILIVVFLAFGFYAVSKFLDYQKTIQVGSFVTYLREDIDKMWKGTSGSVQKSYVVPSNIKKVCFTWFDIPSSGDNRELYRDFELFSRGGENNMFFYPKKNYEEIRLNNIDLGKITEKENPYCIDVVKGKININIKKDIGDVLVTIAR